MSDTNQASPCTDPLKSVQAFCSQWELGIEAIDGAFDQWFLPDTIWDNVGMAVTIGPDQAKAFIHQFRDSIAWQHIRFEVLNIAVNGAKVMTERVDHIVAEDGSTTAALRLMGIFEVDAQGRILAWRDYFDTAAFQ